MVKIANKPNCNDIKPIVVNPPYKVKIKQTYIYEYDTTWLREDEDDKPANISSKEEFINYVNNYICDKHNYCTTWIRFLADSDLPYECDEDEVTIEVFEVDEEIV